MPHLEALIARAGAEGVDLIIGDFNTGNNDLDKSPTGSLFPRTEMLEAQLEPPLAVAEPSSFGSPGASKSPSAGWRISLLDSASSVGNRTLRTTLQSCRAGLWYRERPPWGGR